MKLDGLVLIAISVTMDKELPSTSKKATTKKEKDPLRNEKILAQKKEIEILFQKIKTKLPVSDRRRNLSFNSLGSAQKKSDEKIRKTSSNIENGVRANSSLSKVFGLIRRPSSGSNRVAPAPSTTNLAPPTRGNKINSDSKFPGIISVVVQPPDNEKEKTEEIYIINKQPTRVISNNSDNVNVKPKNKTEIVKRRRKILEETLEFSLKSTGSKGLHMATMFVPNRPSLLNIVSGNLLPKMNRSTVHSTIGRINLSHECNDPIALFVSTVDIRENINGKMEKIQDKGLLPVSRLIQQVDLPALAKNMVTVVHYICLFVMMVSLFPCNAIIGFAVSASDNFFFPQVMTKMFHYTFPAHNILNLVFPLYSVSFVPCTVSILGLGWVANPRSLPVPLCMYIWKRKLVTIPYICLMIYWLIVNILLTWKMVNLQQDLETSMLDELKKVGMSDRWTFSQTYNRCCGVHSYKDWNLSQQHTVLKDDLGRDLYHSSCCDTSYFKCGMNTLESEVLSEGCLAWENFIAAVALWCFWIQTWSMWVALVVAFLYAYAFECLYVPAVGDYYQL